MRIVKPIFWPVLFISCIFLALTMYFLIGGTLSNRMEDIFIAGLIGFVLFAAAKTIKNNANETPVLAVSMMFFWPAVAVLSGILMVRSLADINGNVFEVFNYVREVIRVYPVPEVLQRSLFLSLGIISAVIFIAVQCVTCVLLFVGTIPEKREYRH